MQQPPIRRQAQPPIRRTRRVSAKKGSPLPYFLVLLGGLTVLLWLFHDSPPEPAPQEEAATVTAQTPLNPLEPMFREALDLRDIATARTILSRAESQAVTLTNARADLQELEQTERAEVLAAFETAAQKEDPAGMRSSHQDLALFWPDDANHELWPAEIAALEQRLSRETQAVNLGQQYQNLLQKRQFAKATQLLDQLAKLGESVHAERARLIKTVDLGKVNLRLRFIPAGSFTMGSPPEETQRDADEGQHQVTLTKDFWLGETEITQAQWQALMDTNPADGKGPKRPVENVNIFDIGLFLQKLSAQSGRSFRLPTEAEWEYACRADGTTAFANGPGLGGRQANMDGSQPYGKARVGAYLGKTAPVGRYPANAWGLRDMHGNVWEWTADKYAPYSETPISDPNPSSFMSKYQVVRGGGWADYAHVCRAANRYMFLPNTRLASVGFRVLMERP